jgi:glycosyltransferase involved in cell wall biosynthesis
VQNLGLGASRNRAIAEVTADHWILCLDDADALEPAAIGILQSAIEHAPPGTNLIAHPLVPYGGRTVWNPPASSLDELETRNLFPAARAARSRSGWRSALGRGRVLAARNHDWEFWRRAHRLVGLRVARVHVPAVRYREHAGPRLSNQFKGREELVFTALRRARE